MSYSIVLPTYNEAGNIEKMVSTISNVLDNSKYEYEIVIVDDNSPDDTFAISTKLCKTYPNLKVLWRPSKLGLATAYKFALPFCQGQFIILMDADMSHHPKYIPKMIELQKLYGYDIVYGSRYAQKGGIEGWPLHRKCISISANFIASRLLNTKANDLTGSFRLYKKDVLENIVKQTNSNGYAFQMESVFYAEKNNHTLAHVPIIFRDRVCGSSKLGLNEIFSFFYTLIYLFYKNLF
jgi:dolichol-phosphate mannosyltransferase